MALAGKDLASIRSERTDVKEAFGRSGFLPKTAKFQGKMRLYDWAGTNCT
jgi:hypothetical protein